VGLIGTRICPSKSISSERASERFKMLIYCMTICIVKLLLVTSPGPRREGRAFRFPTVLGAFELFLSLLSLCGPKVSKGND
jgi:hypothetical protein